MEPDDCSTGELRLANGTHPNEGTVEICINKAWGTVCDSQFDDLDAQVICKQLGGFKSEGISK